MITAHPAKLIYLASPYSHDDVLVRLQRFHTICVVAANLMRAGVHLFCPIAMSHPIAEAGALPTGFDYWEAYDTNMIFRCDELWVVTMPGWATSKGVLAEIKIARGLGRPVKYINPDDPIPAWIDEQGPVL